LVPPELNKIHAVLRKVQKNSIVAFLIAGLLVATGIIYAVSSYEEPIEAAAESADEGTTTSTNSVGDSVATSNTSNQGMDPATMVQTSFFAVAALANIGVGAWLIIVVAKARYGKMQIPIMIAAAGSVFLIALYVASRTINLPVVGIQDDIGPIDIVSKVMQGAVVALGVLVIAKWQRVSPSLASTR
jgi:hypothetical protein